MTRHAWLMLLALAACAPRPVPPAPVAAAPPAAATPSVCRVGPDGARPVADRGIGGTGAPAVQVADRGIGGTGIIGVITGFASVCVAGEEVALPDSVPARVDGQPASLDDLRAGQVVTLAATGPAGALQAQSIAVRHVVIGPVQASGVQAGDSGTMTVAGQRVTLAQATGPAIAAKPGDWVAVSGLRQPDGTILATRIDPAPPGRVLVRGALQRLAGTARIGALTVVLPPGTDLPSGFPVTVTGRLQGAVLVADSVVRDVAADSPSRYFGPDVTSFVVESYISVIADGYFVNRDFIRGSGFGTLGSRGRGIATFTRRPEGGLLATGLRAWSGGFAPPEDRFSPAPVPRAGFGPGLGGRGGGLGAPGGRFLGGFGQGRAGLGPRRVPSQDGGGGFSNPGLAPGLGIGGGAGGFGPR